MARHFRSVNHAHSRAVGIKLATSDMMRLSPRRLGTRLIAALALGLGISACSVVVEQRGDLPDPAKVATIKAGSTTRDAVTSLLGSPSSVAAFDPNTWYYISSRFETHTFTRPELVDQEVVIVKFNDANVVTGVEHRNLNDSQPVELVNRETPAPGRELSFMEQLIGNLGRFNKSDDSIPGGNGRTAGNTSGS